VLQALAMQQNGKIKYELETDSSSDLVIVHAYLPEGLTKRCGVCGVCLLLQFGASQYKLHVLITPWVMCAVISTSATKQRTAAHLTQCRYISMA
jgi:hypothetical protein